MADSSHVDVLKRMRTEVVAEMDTLRNALAGKQKQLDSLNQTIDLMRGWVDAEELAPKRSFNRYDSDKIRSGIEDFFAEKDGPQIIRDICIYLAEKDLVPEYSDAVRNKVGIIIKSIPSIGLTGTGLAARYYLKSVNNGANGHATSHTESISR